MRLADSPSSAHIDVFRTGPNHDTMEASCARVFSERRLGDHGAAVGGSSAQDLSTHHKNTTPSITQDAMPVAFREALEYLPQKKDFHHFELPEVLDEQISRPEEGGQTYEFFNADSLLKSTKDRNTSSSGSVVPQKHLARHTRDRLFLDQDGYDSGALAVAEDNDAALALSARGKKMKTTSLLPSNMMHETMLASANDQSQMNSWFPQAGGSTCWTSTQTDSWLNQHDAATGYEFDPQSSWMHYDYCGAKPIQIPATEMEELSSAQKEAILLCVTNFNRGVDDRLSTGEDDQQQGGDPSFQGGSSKEDRADQVGGMGKISAFVEDEVDSQQRITTHGNDYDTQGQQTRNKTETKKSSSSRHKDMIQLHGAVGVDWYQQNHMDTHSVPKDAPPPICAEFFYTGRCWRRRDQQLRISGGNTNLNSLHPAPLYRWNSARYYDELYLELEEKESAWVCPEVGADVEQGATDGTTANEMNTTSVLINSSSRSNATGSVLRPVAAGGSSSVASTYTTGAVSGNDNLQNPSQKSAGHPVITTSEGGSYSSISAATTSMMPNIYTSSDELVLHQTQLHQQVADDHDLQLQKQQIRHQEVVNQIEQKQHKIELVLSGFNRCIHRNCALDHRFVSAHVIDNHDPASGSNQNKLWLCAICNNVNDAQGSIADGTQTHHSGGGSTTQINMLSTTNGFTPGNSTTSAFGLGTGAAKLDPTCHNCGSNREWAEVEGLSQDRLEMMRECIGWVCKSCARFNLEKDPYCSEQQDDTTSQKQNDGHDPFSSGKSGRLLPRGRRAAKGLQCEFCDTIQSSCSEMNKASDPVTAQMEEQDSTVELGVLSNGKRREVKVELSQK